MLLYALELLLREQLSTLAVDRHAGAQNHLLPKDSLKPFSFSTCFSDKGMFLELSQTLRFPNPKKSGSRYLFPALIAVG